MMKTVSYRLLAEIERLSPSSQKDWFRGYLQEILESDRPYYVKTDYIALSFIELEHRINYLGQEIKSLTALRKKLQQARALGLEIAARILDDYGIEKMEGTVISSLTITPESTKAKEILHIKDPDKVMALGYVKFSVDEAAVKKALRHEEMRKELAPYIEVERTEEHHPPKLRINKKRIHEVTVVEPDDILDAA